MADEPVYLGDGLYASFDGEHVVLMANSHITPSDTVYLNADVYAALERYVAMLKQSLRERDTQEGNDNASNTPL